MPNFDRRRFLASSFATAVSLKAFPQAAAAVPLRAGPGRPVSVPANFVGLSYETQQLSEPSFFSPINKALVERFREVSPNGVLRLGGNTSDYGFWKPTPSSVAPLEPSASTS